MINHEHKCIFLHIPKTGGTSIEKFFKAPQGHHELPRDQIPNFSTSMSINEKGYLKYYGARVHYDELNEKICSDYFMFTFVRNPWDRIISLYKFWVEKPRNGGEFAFARERLQSVPACFKFFAKNIDYIFSLLPKDERVHILPQYELNGNHAYLDYLDFVGRFENFQQDFDTICDKIGIPRQKLPHENKTNHKHYTEYYDDETREIVERKYAKDIEYFGYKFGE